MTGCARRISRGTEEARRSDDDAERSAKERRFVKAIPVFGSESQLPASVGGLAFVHVEYFADPRLGVSIRYGKPTTAKADAYLYDLGLSDIPSDLGLQQVVEWFQHSCQDVMLAAERGLYLDFEVLASRYLHIPPGAPDPFCLWASFAYRQISGPGVFTGRRVSNLALRTDRGHINKVRYTYPEDAGEHGFAGFLGFVVEWTYLVQGARGRT
jgi:hypothetical protein